MSEPTTKETVIVRAGILSKQRESRYLDEPMVLNKNVEGLRTLAVIGKTFYWNLKLEGVPACREV